MQGPEARTLRAIGIEKVPLGKHQARPGESCGSYAAQALTQRQWLGGLQSQKPELQSKLAQPKEKIHWLIELTSPEVGFRPGWIQGFRCHHAWASPSQLCFPVWVGFALRQAWSLLVAKAARGSSSRTLCLSHSGGGGTPRGQPRSYHRDRKDGPGPVRATVVTTDIRGRVRANLEHVGCFPETGLP